MIKLYLVDGTEEIQSFDFKKTTITVGRSSQNDIQISDAYVSRRHMRISRRDGRYFIEDLKSRNGTFVNGAQAESGCEIEVREGVPVTVGMSLICLGRTSVDHITRFVASLHKSEELSAFVGVSVEDRPLTHQRNFELIYSVSNALRSSTDLKEIMESILDHIFGLLKRIDRGAILIVDKESRKISEVFSRQNPDTGPAQASYSKTLVERVVKESKGFMVLDTFSEESSALSESIRMMKIRSALCVPLISRRELRGVIYLDSIKQPYGFRTEDLSLLTALSGSAAVAIENALLSSPGKPVPIGA
jgi:hypothetical protein